MRRIMELLSKNTYYGKLKQVPEYKPYKFFLDYLDLEYGDSFYLVEDGIISTEYYIITDKGFFCQNGMKTPGIINRMVEGRAKILYRPVTNPVKGKTYWYIDINELVWNREDCDRWDFIDSFVYYNDSKGISLLLSGLIFRTLKQAYNFVPYLQEFIKAEGDTNKKAKK